MTNDLQTLEDKIASRIDTAAAGNMMVSNEAGGLDFANVGQVMEFAKMMAISQIGVRKHLRNNPGACLAVCVQAIEWRMSPFAVANKSYLVNDQIAYEASMLQAVILSRAPIKGRLKHEYSGAGADRRLKVWAELRDEPGEIVEYETPLFRDITPKNSPLWKNDPDQQMHYYAARAWCRRHFPDVILGVYADDELPAHQGPERAKDVTPLAERLAAANKASTGFDPAFVTSETATAETPHDPVTGEVIEAETTNQPIAADASPGSGAQADPEKQTEAPASGSATDQASQGDGADFPGDRPSTAATKAAGRKFIKNLAE
jgi:hypothetical protein